MNATWEHFPEDEKARLAIYDRVADNFAALARVLRSSRPDTMISIIEQGKEESEEQEEGEDGTD